MALEAVGSNPITHPIKKPIAIAIGFFVSPDVPHTLYDIAFIYVRLTNRDLKDNQTTKTAENLPFLILENLFDRVTPNNMTIVRIPRRNPSAWLGCCLAINCKQYTIIECLITNNCY